MLRKIGVLCLLVIAGAWGDGVCAQTSGCPGVSACVYNQGCPAASTQVNPGQSIQAAIIAAAPGTTLCVNPGTYPGLIDFLGKPIRLISSGGPTLTILDGGGAGPVVTFSLAEGRDSILDGFTIRNGQAPYGGGILIQQASPTIRNCIVSDNWARGSRTMGGGIGVIRVQSNPSITCTQFLRNRADFYGGGLMSTFSASICLPLFHPVG